METTVESGIHLGRRLYATILATRSAHEDFADVVYVVVLADLRDFVAVEEEVEVIAVGVLLPVGCGRIRFGFRRRRS